MADERLKQLVNLLSTKTMDRKVNWEKTVDEGVYQAAFSGYSVHLLRTGGGGQDYTVQIFNEAGELVEEVSDVDLDEGSPGNYFELMKNMYVHARRTVMGVDRAIDTIFEELR